MIKRTLVGVGLAVMFINANAMETHEAPFVGINPVMNMCHIIAEDGEFGHQGPAETKLTINANYVLATCKAEYLVDKENPVDIQGRVDVPCRIGIPGWVGLEVRGPSDGMGGFTVSQGGIVTAHCKAPR